MIVIYSKPNCPQCDLTKRDMDILGIYYEEVDITESPEQMQALIDEGFRAAPVVKTDTQVWSGYDQERIKALMDYESETFVEKMH